MSGSVAALVEEGALEDEQELIILRFIFDHLDRDRSGVIDSREVELFPKPVSRASHQPTLASVGKFLSQATANFAQDNRSDQSYQHDFPSFVKMMTARRTHLLRERLATVLSHGLMPLLYAISTRLPFIFVAVEITKVRDASFSEVCLVLGCYQTCRAMANGLVGTFNGDDPFRRWYLLATISSCLGWGLSWWYPQEHWYTLFILCLVGCSESVVPLQSCVMAEAAVENVTGLPNKQVVAKRLRFQYTGVSLGAATAFVAGGWYYQETGFDGACIVGMVASVLNLVCALLYLLLRPRSLVEEEIMESLKEPGSPGRSAPIRDSTWRKQRVARAAYKLAAAEALTSEVRSHGFDSEAVSVVQHTAAQNHELRNALCELYDEARQQTRRTEEEPGVQTEELKLIMGLAAERDAPRNAALTVDEQAQLVMTIMTMTGSGAEQDAVFLRTFVTFLQPRVHLLLHPDVANQPDTVFRYVHFVIATQAVMAFCIGTFLSTSLLYYTEVHGLSNAETGLLLGLGEFAAVLMMTISSQVAPRLKKLRSAKGLRFPSTHKNAFADGLLALKRRNSMQASSLDIYSLTFHSLMASISSRPLHVPIIVLCVGALTIIFTVPNVVLAVIVQEIFSALNDFSVSLLNELTATSIPPGRFAKNQAYGQWLRRLGNCLTAFTGPWLFGIKPWLPFVTYGGIVVVWALILWRVLYHRAREITPGIGKGAFPPITAFLPFAGNKQWHTWEKEQFNATNAGGGRPGAINEHLLARELALVRAESKFVRPRIKELENQLHELRKELQLSAGQRTSFSEKQEAMDKPKDQNGMVFRTERVHYSI